MIRVLFVLRDALPQFRTDVNALFGRYLLLENVSTDLIGQRRPDHVGEISWPAGKAFGAGVYRQGMFGELIRPLQDAWVLLRRRGQFDLLQVRDKIRTGVLAYFFARLCKKPFVYWMSFPFVEGFEKTARNRGGDVGTMIKLADYLRITLSRRIFYGFILPKADHVFVQSEAMRDWLIKKGMDAKRMTAVPMGVDTELMRRENIVPVDDERLAGRRVIVYIGFLGKSRDSAFLLDLVLALKEMEPAILLVLAGDAESVEEEKWIREEIARRFLQGHVLLTGWLSQDEALRYAVRAEIGLSPLPRGELYDVSSPTKLVEYLALGIPAVANDIPDQKLVLERSGAGICAPMDIHAFSDAILSLLRDEPLRRQLAERGPAYVRKERAYSAIARRVAETYRELLEARA